MVLLSACGGGGEPSVAPQPAPIDGGTAVGPTAGKETRNADATAILTAVLAEGTMIGDSGIDIDAVDGRPVIAWFWASWCTICRAEGPTIAEIAETYRDDVVLIGVPGRGSIDDMDRFIDDTGTRAITHVADLDGGIWSQFGVFAQPAFAFIAPDGEVEVFVGTLGERGLIDRIESLLEA